MMAIDFIIHPEHAIMTGYADIETYREYIRYMDEICRKSDYPILVEGHEKGSFDAQFPIERRLRSTSHYIGSTPVDEGTVRPEDWEKLTGIAQKGEHFLVHGTYFGQCVEGFAIQLFAYIKRGEHWNNWLANPDKHESRREENLRETHEANDDFSDCGIKYGVVLASPQKKTEIRRPCTFMQEKEGRKIPIQIAGNITYQLMDEKTKVFRSRTARIARS